MKPWKFCDPGKGLTETYSFASWLLWRKGAVFAVSGVDGLFLASN